VKNCHPRRWTGGAASAASSLSREEANEVTVVDLDEDILRNLQDRLDIRTVAGNASYPTVLEGRGRSGGRHHRRADQQRRSQHDGVRSGPHALSDTDEDRPDTLIGIHEPPPNCSATMRCRSTCSSAPSSWSTEYVERLIKYPGALQVLDFADGKVQLVGVRALGGGPLVGQHLRELPQHLPKAAARVVAIYRAGRSVAPEGDTVIEDGDEVFFLAARNDIRRVMNELRKQDDPVKRGRDCRWRQHWLQARADAREEQPGEADRAGPPARGARHPSYWKNAIVLNGDAADEELLIEEKHRQRRRVRCTDQLRRGQHPVGDAGQAAGGSQGPGADQQALICRPDREQHHRHCDLAADDHDWARSLRTFAVAMSFVCTHSGAAPRKHWRQWSMATRAARA